MEVWCQKVTFVHRRGIFVDAEEKCCRLSTQEVLFVEVWCQKMAFVHAEGAHRGSSVPGAIFWVPVGGFCSRIGYLLWTLRKKIAARPRRRCFLWKFDARRWLLSTGGGIFVDAKKNVAACPRRRCFLWKFGARRWHLSTLRVSSVEVQCLEQPSGCSEVTFVHKKGPFRGGMGLQVFVWKGEIVGKRIFLLPLFANHNIQNHFVCGLHPFCANAAEVADCLFNAIFYDTVV